MSNLLTSLKEKAIKAGVRIKQLAGRGTGLPVPGLPGLNGESARGNNKILRKKQRGVVVVSVCIVLVLIGGVKSYWESSQESKRLAKTKTSETGRRASGSEVLKIELADKALDPELHWRNFYEELRRSDRLEFEKRLKEIEKSQEAVLSKAKKAIDTELAGTKRKLMLAHQELEDAGMELTRVARMEQERINGAPPHMETLLEAEYFEDEIEFFRPKSAKNYVPEGTYFTGYLLGGIMVSTALNTAADNATPVSFRLKHRGNLSKLNKTDISKCRIMGSAYGDLSSERAIIRLEKMICEKDGFYTASRVAGQIFGADGFNGIKGTVISTASKHIKNAMIGGIISGLSSSAKGQDGMSILSGGLTSTQKKGFKDLAGGGLLKGVGNAGDKLAEYYLKQAEAMSPVLTIPSGARVNLQITKGFFMGEKTTHRRIKNGRKGAKQIKKEQKR
ncbi:MAG: conjugal transfer protein TraB [Rickettsiales bacterium]|nr:MAG: conjugal transfer protein TraB [Rickettsiales bacterium]